jgi:diguanylate cyclase (GGDEF)-like protein
MSSHEQHGFGDRRLMGPVSGFLWLTAAAAAIVCQLLPGTPREHPFIVWGLIALVLVYGVACVRSWIAWERMTLTHHSIAVIAFQPLIALGLWVSGGVDSYLGPILALPTIYVAYFFPPRLALPLGLLEIATFFSPVVYTADAEQHLMLERTVAYAAAYAGLTFTIQLMTRRLAAAEAHQRRMAHEDPLTGLPNRRAFDRALDGALAGEDRFALLLIDVDHFKAINDTFGHVVGDEVLCALAERVRGEIRASDTIARIGGDELAVVAPNASAGGAERLAGALREAAAAVRPADDADPVALTISWATFPDDGADRTELLRVADRRLHEVKDARVAPAAAAVDVA